MSEENAHQASTAGINPLDGEVVLQNVHPSWVNWKWRLFFTLLLLVAGVGTGGGAGNAMMVFGVLLFLSVYSARRRSRYIVTNQRIKKRVGLLSSTTNETRFTNVNGVSTSSGILEGLIGKGTVSITDAAGETFTISGVGNYDELSRTLREQHQSASQPGHGGHQRAPAPTQQGTSPAATQRGTGPAQQRGGSPRAQTRGGQTATNTEQDEPQSGDRAPGEASSDDESSRERCRDCDSLVDADVSFCPECGADDPFSASAERQEDSTVSTDRIEEEPTARVEPEPQEHPVASIADRRRPDSSVAAELCQALAAEEVDERRLEDALDDAVEALETAATVTDTVERIDDPSDRQQLESARRELVAERGRLPAALEPILDRTLTVGDDLEACENERDRLQTAADAVCQSASRTADVQLHGENAADRATLLAERIESGDIVEDRSEPVAASIAADLERSVRPQSSQSRKLLETLGEPASEDVETVLRSTVDSLDAYADLQASVADIGDRDVRRRLDALDDELQRMDGDIYRHLADRVRELEAMLEREGVTDVQLYAIYQETTFYDRTLLPRLSRSLDGESTADTGKLIADIDDRIEAIEREYIDVRADHNHTIPRHFLSLATDLREEAQRIDGDDPLRAVGLCAAADDVLAHVEALYERNEYSVMLRRLRG